MSRAVAHVRSNAIAYVALFLALGAGAYAATKAPKNSVVSKSIKNEQVKAADIGKDQVRSSEVADGAVGSAEIGSGGVLSEEIADGVVTGADLASGAVSGADQVVNSGRVAIDDPAGAGATKAQLLSSGPFTILASCTEDTVNNEADLSLRYIATTPAYVAEDATGAGTDLVEANVEVDLAFDVLDIGPNNSIAGPGMYAVALDGRFISLSTQFTAKPIGDAPADCVVHASGLAG